MLRDDFVYASIDARDFVPLAAHCPLHLLGLLVWVISLKIADDKSKDRLARSKSLGEEWLPHGSVAFGKVMLSLLAKLIFCRLM